MPDREPATSNPRAELTDPPARSNGHAGNGHHLEMIEIDTGKTKRRRGLVGYVIIFLAVAGLLVFLFVRFTGSIRLAVLLVGFMMTYMAVMGWLASGKIDERR